MSVLSIHGIGNLHRNPPVIMLDVDCVLASFITGFRELAYKLFGFPIFAERDAQIYDVTRDLSREQVDEVWGRILSSTRFWYDLLPISTVSERDRLRDLSAIVYFVTSRAGTLVREQTIDWLKMWRFRRDPTVVLSKFKGEAAKVLGAEYALEDKAENAWCIAWLSPQTKSYLLDWPYNRYDATAFGASKVERVGSLWAFLDAVEEEEDWRV